MSRRARQGTHADRRTYELIITTHMGSGGKRKSNDTVRINRPMKRGSSEGTGGGGNGGGSGRPRDINVMCPPAFEVSIKPSKTSPDGTPVTVTKEELLVQSEVVGKLSEKQLEMMVECGGEGIQYTGRVVNKGTKAYARFEQRV